MNPTWSSLPTFLDTHAAIYLWEGEVDRFGRDSLVLLRESDLFLSPFVRLELAYLKEVQKLIFEPDALIADLVLQLAVSLSADSLAEIISGAMKLTWTRDPFDRLITVTVLLHDAPLITRDRNIHEHYAYAVW